MREKIKFIITHPIVYFLYLLQKADSDDSGNEEPDVAQDFSPLPVHPSAKNVRPTHYHKIDKLSERIASLTLPRDRDSDYVPEGLVDSLPPEGMYSSVHL